MGHKVINRTPNGLMFYCGGCKLVHIEYKNLNFNFTNDQLQKFSQYIFDLKGEEWEIKNEYSPFRRKIVVPISHDPFNFLLNMQELNELKTLLQKPKNNPSVTELLKKMNDSIRCN